MLNILYLLNHAGKAGTERYVYYLIENLHKDKIKPYFVYNETGLLVERIKKLNIETFNITMRHPFDVIAAFKLSRICKKLNIHIIHTQFLRENYIALLAKIFYPEVKVVNTSHFIMENSLLIRFCNKLLSKLQSKIISVCTIGKKQLILNGFPESKIEVIFNGIDPVEWSEYTSENTLKDNLDIENNTFIISCASRFAHDKGHEFLVRGLYELKKITQKNFMMLLANDGPLLDDTKNLVKNLGLDNNVKFIGFVENIKELYYLSDLYINSSEHEALSFAILEVLACGIPLIATDIAGNPDIINTATNCGILVEYNNPVELAKKINLILNDENLQKELSKNARTAVENIFHIKIMLQKTFNIYRTI